VAARAPEPDPAPATGRGSSRRTPRRRPTATSAFGVGRREGHDSSAFYERFAPPELSDDATVPSDPSVRAIDRVIHGSSTDMAEVADGSVALVVTSPPYFAGKAYETELDAEHVPSTYLEYLQMLRDVFAECVRTLEPGGRIAVNVANLGRRPFRSLAADVTSILQDDLRLLLRGEVIWVKQRGASGSCAWGSFQRAANPVLRDLTERVVIASKGRFDRAVPQAERARAGLPSTSTMYRDEFMDATLDLWEIPPESAKRVGHPAPFPVELPQRLINLYTYRGDLVLDPFMGSGTTAVAALRTGRHFVGYDTDADYVDAAVRRVDDERARLGELRLPRVPSDAPEPDDVLERARVDGRGARELAEDLLAAAGFDPVERPAKEGGVEYAFGVCDVEGRRLLVGLSGSVGGSNPGLGRPDAVWRELGRAAHVARTAPDGAGPPPEVVLLSTSVPARSSTAGRALSAAIADGTLREVLLLDEVGLEVLTQLAKGLRPGVAGWSCDGPLAPATSAGRPQR
jgi:site-specific DNA-methyltransferase (adenine-specific)